MITDSFDRYSEEIIKVNRNADAPVVDACILTFSHIILKYVLENFKCEKIGDLFSANGTNPIYNFDYEGKTFAIYMSPIGGPACVADIEDSFSVINTNKYIVFGGSGCLNKEIARGKVMVPVSAYRDEGTSYHYAPASDYINIKNADVVAEFMESAGIPYIKGKTWTTDSVHRETRGNFEKRKAEGCISVEMECAAVQAMCDFRGIEAYFFFTSGDLLDAPKWDARMKEKQIKHTQHDSGHFDIALELAKYVADKEATAPVSCEAPSCETPASLEKIHLKQIQMGAFVPEECIFYQIYPIGFCGAPKVNTGEPATNRIDAVRKWIPHMKSIGVNALYLGPIFESGCHGYDTHDFRLIDTRLGTNEDFITVCKALREAGIHLILDGVFNHVGRGFFAVQDVLKNRQASPYCGWISGLRFDGNNSYNDNLRYDNWAGHDLLVKLNLKNPDVVEYLLSSVDMWIDEFGIEGLRLDAADCIDHDFFRALKRRTKAKNPDFWLMGEITNSSDYRVWANPDMLDSVTNYECYKGLYSSVNSKNMFEIAHGIARQFGPWGLYKELTLYNFLDNHDVNRIVNMVNDRRHLKNLYTLMYTMPGAPSIYYGSEWAIEGQKSHHNDSPLRPYIDVDNPQITDRELLEHLKYLAEIRQNSHALMHGTYEQVQIQNEQYAFARVSDKETAVVFLNISSETKTIYADFKGRHFEVTLPAFSSEIIKM